MSKFYRFFSLTVILLIILALVPLALAQEDSNTVEVALEEFNIVMPDSLPAGPVVLEITNNGTEEHSLAIQGDGFQEEMDSNLQPGEVGTLEVNLEPGTYEVYCSVGNHREEGMLLNLTVTEAETTDTSAEAVTTEEGAAAQTSEETVAEEETATEPTEETITEEQPAAETAEETAAEEPAALPETGGVIVPWSQIGLISVGALMLVGGLGLTFLLRKH